MRTTAPATSFVVARGTRPVAPACHRGGSLARFSPGRNPWPGTRHSGQAGPARGPRREESAALVASTLTSPASHVHGDRADPRVAIDAAHHVNRDDSLSNRGPPPRLDVPDTPTTRRQFAVGAQSRRPTSSRDHWTLPLAFVHVFSERSFQAGTALRVEPDCGARSEPPATLRRATPRRRWGSQVGRQARRSHRQSTSPPCGRQPMPRIAIGGNICGARAFSTLFSECSAKAMTTPNALRQSGR